MADAIQGQPCSVTTCSAAAAGTGAQTPKPLCQRHLDRDTDRVRELQARVQARLHPLRIFRNRLRTNQQALEAEQQGAEDLLNAAIESLMKHKEAVTSRLNARNDAAKRKLREFAVLQEFDSSVAAAESANDLRGVFELASRMELECSDLEEALDDGDRDERVVGDVCGGLRDLQLLMDRQLSDVMKLCESVGPLCELKSICEFHSEIQGLPGKPWFVSSCSNTKGFSADASGKVVKAESAVDGAERLPESCLFVAFHYISKMDHLLACSIDGSVKMRVQADLDWSRSITGLSCDSKRQALYIAQLDLVKVTDLSGCVSREINSSSLGQPVRLMGLTCSSDNIIALNTGGTETQLLCIDKDSGQLQTSVSVPSVSLDNYIKSMSVIDHAVLITDLEAGKLYKVCIASGQLISTFPTKRSLLDKLQWPSGVMAHRCGLVFASECGRHVVRVMRSDGTVLQTLRVEVWVGSGGGKMNSPLGLAMVDDGDYQLLAVCQRDRKIISLFRVFTGSPCSVP